MTPLETLLTVAGEVLSQHFPEALRAAEAARADGDPLPWTAGGRVLLARWRDWTQTEPYWSAFTPFLNEHNLGALIANWREP